MVCSSSRPDHNEVVSARRWRSKEVKIGERMDRLGNQIKITETNLGETTRLARGAGE